MFLRYLLILCTALNIGSFSAIAAAAAGAGEPDVLQVPKSMIAELFAQPEQTGGGDKGDITINGGVFIVDLICRSNTPRRAPREIFEDLPDILNFTKGADGEYFYNIEVDRNVIPHGITVYSNAAFADRMSGHVGPAAGAIPLERVSVWIRRR